MCGQWDPEIGPSEVPHFAQGTGLEANSTAYRHLYTNWSLTTTRALAAVQVCMENTRARAHACIQDMNWCLCTSTWADGLLIALLPNDLQAAGGFSWSNVNCGQCLCHKEIERASLPQLASTLLTREAPLPCAGLDPLYFGGVGDRDGLYLCGSPSRQRSTLHAPMMPSR